MPRSTTDRPDEATGPQVHVVYLVPVDMPDEQLDKLGVLHDSMSSVNSWLRQQTGDKQWRLDTFTFVWDDPRTDRRESKKVQAVDVTFLPYRLPSERVRDLSGVEGALKLAGLDEDGKRYIVYVASSAGGVCGSAYWTLEPTGEFDGKYSDIFLYSDSACRSMEFATGPRSPSYAETIVMQELMHNDGVVPMTAPHNCLVSQGAYGHVCTGPLWATDNDPEEFDVMYPYVSLPLSEKSLDADRLDYFRHPFPVRDFEDSPYLETVPQ